MQDNAINMFAFSRVDFFINLHCKMLNFYEMKSKVKKPLIKNSKIFTKTNAKKHKPNSVNKTILVMSLFLSLGVNLLKWIFHLKKT
jgi:hypothetical protein